MAHGRWVPVGRGISGGMWWGLGIGLVLVAAYGLSWWASGTDGGSDAESGAPIIVVGLVLAVVGSTLLGSMSGGAAGTVVAAGQGRDGPVPGRTGMSTLTRGGAALAAGVVVAVGSGIVLEDPVLSTVGFVVAVGVTWWQAPRLAH